MMSSRNFLPSATENLVLPAAMAEADAIVPKRLIIYGLTPAIDANALAQRLSSFGNVHSLVGVGMLDANGDCKSTLRWPGMTLMYRSERLARPPMIREGDPRKFAHLTLETTKAKLSRCAFFLLFT